MRAVYYNDTKATKEKGKHNNRYFHPSRLKPHKCNHSKTSGLTIDDVSANQA